MSMLNKPYLVVEWNDTETDAVGWLCCFNFVSNYCSGGLRVHETVTREEVIKLATGMGYKYAACYSKVGGGAKAGIRYDNTKPDKLEVVKRFLLAISPYLENGVSLGGDLGIGYGQVMDLYKEMGIPGVPHLVAKKYENDPKIIQGLKDNDTLFDMPYRGFVMYDAITGYGAAAGLDESWKQMGGKPGASVMIQGFGAVGTGAARCLNEMGYKIVAVSDARCMVYCEEGLDADLLIDSVKDRGYLNQEAFKPEYKVMKNSQWEDISCDIFMPAALDGVINGKNAEKLDFKLIVEAANIPTTPEADVVLERRGIPVAPDFIVNLGATRLCDAVPFGLIPLEAQALIDDSQSIIREHIRNLFCMKQEQRITLREAARIRCQPLPSEAPDVEWNEK